MTLFYFITKQFRFNQYLFFFLLQVKTASFSASPTPASSPASKAKQGDLTSVRTSTTSSDPRTIHSNKFSTPREAKTTKTLVSMPTGNPKHNIKTQQEADKQLDSIISNQTLHLSNKPKMILATSQTVDLVQRAIK